MSKLTRNKINEILNLKDGSSIEEQIRKILWSDTKEKVFDELIKIEEDLSFDWFHQYYQEEYSDRKVNKQDFTPQSISEIISKITGETESNLDCCAGTGGLTISKWFNNQNKETTYFLEELSNKAIWFLLLNLSIRNMNAIVYFGDALLKKYDSIFILKKGEKYSSIEEEKEIKDFPLFETIISNPPYSQDWNSNDNLLKDPRFSSFNKLAPKSKADFAFIQHMIYSLSEKGTMAVVLPHGVLFRGGSEGDIRKTLIEKLDYIDAIIGLPGKLFLGTAIPTCILVFKKKRKNRDILFIDASLEFEKEGKNNILEESNINKIIDTYKNRKSINKYSHIASLSEIEKNEFNLNIPRYVDSFEKEEEIDLVENAKELLEIKKEIVENNEKLYNMLSELVMADGSSIPDILKKPFEKK